jgi:hypothetical protein
MRGSTRTVKRRVKRPRPAEQNGALNNKIHTEPPTTEKVEKQPLTLEQLDILNKSLRIEGGLFKTIIDALKSSQINAVEYSGGFRLQAPMPAPDFSDLKNLGFKGLMLTDNGEIVRYGFNYPGLNGSAELQTVLTSGNFSQQMSAADKIRQGFYDTCETLCKLTPAEIDAVTNYLAAERDIFSEAKKEGFSGGKKTNASANFEVRTINSIEDLKEKKSLYVEDNFEIYTALKELLENFTDYKRSLSALGKLGFKPEASLIAQKGRLLNESGDAPKEPVTQKEPAPQLVLEEVTTVPRGESENPPAAETEKPEDGEKEKIAEKTQGEYNPPEMETVITVGAPPNDEPAEKQTGVPPPAPGTIVIEIVPEDMPGNERLAYQDIRQIANSLLDESVLIYSLPLPDKADGKIADCFFGIAPSGFDNSCEAPFGVYRVDTAERRLIPSGPQEQHPRRCHFRSRPFEEFSALEERYGALYLKVRSFAFKPVLSQDEVANLSDFIMTLKDLEGEDLSEIYESAVPNFFDWLKTFTVE